MAKALNISRRRICGGVGPRCVERERTATPRTHSGPGPLLRATPQDEAMPLVVWSTTPPPCLLSRCTEQRGLGRERICASPRECSGTHNLWAGMPGGAGGACASHMRHHGTLGTPHLDLGMGSLDSRIADGTGSSARFSSGSGCVRSPRSRGAVRRTVGCQRLWRRGKVSIRIKSRAASQGMGKG